MVLATAGVVHVTNPVTPGVSEWRPLRGDSRRPRGDDPPAKRSRRTSAFSAAAEAGLYKLNAVDPQLETAWFQPLSL